MKRQVKVRKRVFWGWGELTIQVKQCKCTFFVLFYLMLASLGKSGWATVTHLGAHIKVIIVK